MGGVTHMPRRATAPRAGAYRDVIAAMIAMIGDAPISIPRAGTSYPRGTRSPGDLAHKRWKRRRAAGRA